MKKIIIYDFDGTLTPNPIPNFKLLEQINLTSIKDIDFQTQIRKNAINKNIDLYESLYQTYFDLVKKSGIKITDDNLSLGAKEIKYNKGVKSFLKTLTQNNIDNYLLSSGITVYLNNILISKYFKKIYGTTFTYDENKEVNGIDFLMSDKNKVRAIKDILKSNNLKDNNCSNIIYIGDGLTDYYAMKYVKENGGITIFLDYNQDKNIINELKEKNIVSLFTKPNYSKNSELYLYIKKIFGIKE